MKILQQMVGQAMEITRLPAGVADGAGLILACSDEKKIGQTIPNVQEIRESKTQFTIINHYAYKKVTVKNKLEYFIFMEYTNEASLNYLSLLALNIANIKPFYDEKFDRTNFIKNIILDNILPGDVTMRAKELHLANDVYRVAFLIKTDKVQDAHTHDVLQSLFPNKAKDFIIMLDDESVALIKELKTDKESKEIERISKTIIDTLNAELMLKTTIGIGSIVDNIRDIARSFKEAKMALLIGGIFEGEKSIINYDNLGIGRLIYQLPMTLCKLFLDEVFKNNSYDSFDSETLLTIQRFFENDLNISEASRELYIHRNTLEYRLKKIEKLTGLDLKKFDDAIILKVAMMVKRYVDNCGNTI